MTRPAYSYSIGVNELIHDQDRSSSVARARDVTVHFGDVTARCEEFIRASEEVVGAVAWVRSPRLVRALAERPVALIVNKEFVLRRPGSKERSSLDGLHGGVHGFGAAISPVRCLGDCSRNAFTGLMHHKFLIRLERGKPTAVWTGSFNLTSGAGGNFENAIEIDDPRVAGEFFAEFARLYDISEPLDFREGAPAGAQRTSSSRKPSTRTRPSAGKKPKTIKPSGKTPAGEAEVAPAPRAGRARQGRLRGSAPTDLVAPHRHQQRPAQGHRERGAEHHGHDRR